MATTPLEVVRHLIGVQAQIPSAAALAVRVRTVEVRAADLDRETGQGGSIVRTWLMRGTLHLAAADDVDWLLALLAPTVLRLSGRRHAQLGLDDATLTRSTDVLGRLLENGPVARSELFSGLAAQGIDPAGQRGIHLIRHAALHGLLCCGPDLGREQTWVLRQISPRKAVSRDEALAMLAGRYRSGYGPAGPRDLAAWSGLPVPDARHAWRLAGESDGEARHPVAGSPTVRLLPHFDEYLLGYANRDHAVAAQHRKKVWTGGGYVLPTVVVDGWAVGTWRSKGRGGGVAVDVRPFHPGHLDADVAAGLDAEVAQIARFLARDASWSVSAASESGRGRQPGGTAGH